MEIGIDLGLLLAGILAILGYTKFQKEKTKNAERHLRIVKQRQEFEKFNKEINENIAKAKQSKKDYENAKKYFTDKFDRNK